MAPKKSSGKRPQAAPGTKKPRAARPRKSKKKTASDLVEPSRVDVDAAVIHFVRLAASHAGAGVEFGVAGETGEEAFPIDKDSLAALAEVTKLLLEHRAKMATRAATALEAALHTALTEVFRAAKESPDVLESIEDHVEERVRQMGFSLSRAQKTCFVAVDESYLRKHKGASQAAADVLAAAIRGGDPGKRLGRGAYRAKAERKERPPVTAPLNRYVPLRDVARYFDGVLAAAAAWRPHALLPLEVLRSGEQPEALLSIVETSYRERLRHELEAQHESVIEFVRMLLRGENPLPNYATAQGDQLRVEFRALGAQVMASAGGTAMLEQMAHAAADFYRVYLNQAFNIG